MVNIGGHFVWITDTAKFSSIVQQVLSQAPVSPQERGIHTASSRFSPAVSTVDTTMGRLITRYLTGALPMSTRRIFPEGCG